MAEKDKRIDQYIAKAQPFARPILTKLRLLVHKGNPQVEETIKWGMPFFDYKGLFCSMAAFRQHAVFGFWKYKLINDPKNYLCARSHEGGPAMGNLGRITSIKDIPPDNVMLDFIRQAKKLNDQGVKLPQRPHQPNKTISVPDYFLRALKQNTKAQETFEKFPPSHKREYIEWVTEAKQEETRLRRMKTALEWLSEGKGRNCKYEK